MGAIERIDWIRAFVTVTELGSFTAAALEMHKSQSRISSYVAGLERSLGHQLLDRSRQPVRLTDAGTTFLRRARTVLGELEAARSELDRLDGTVRGQIVLGALPSISAMFVPEILRRMQLFHPEVRIDTMERTTGRLLDNLLEGTLDIALRCTTGEAIADSKSSRVLWGEPIVAVFPETHPKANGKRTIRAQELNSFPIGATGTPGVGIDPDLGVVFNRWGITAERLNFHTEQPQTLINLAKNGLVIPVINLLAYLSCEHSGLTYRVINGEMTARHVGIFWNPEREQSAAAEALMAVVLAAPVPAGTTDLRGR